MPPSSELPGFLAYPLLWIFVRQEKADVVAFMKALTGPLPAVESGRLPE